MKAMGPLAFLGDYSNYRSELRGFSYIYDYYDCLPETGGCYIVTAGIGTSFLYPWGSSPVFYIGKSKRLNWRLWEHYESARAAAREAFWSPVHHYEAAFKPRFCYIKTWQRMTADALEQEVLARFITRYGAPPVACGQMRWKRVYDVAEKLGRQI